MKKCILSIGVALLLGLFLVLSIASAEGEVPVTVDASDQVDVGVNFIVTVTIGAVTNFDACDYEVHFDSTVITLTNVTNGSVCGTTIPVIGINEIAPGRVKVVENVPGFPGVTGSGYLAELHFHIVGSSGSSSTINLEEGCLSDNTATEIPATWIGATVGVFSHRTYLPLIIQSHPPPTSTSTATATGCLGDERMSFDPAEPIGGDTVTITVTSARAHTDVVLTGLESPRFTGVATANAQGDPVVTVTVDAPDTVIPGSDFTARVNITQVENFDACDYEIHFDSTVITLTGVTDGNIGGTTIPGNCLPGSRRNG